VRDQRWWRHDGGEEGRTSRSCSVTAAIAAVSPRGAARRTPASGHGDAEQFGAALAAAVPPRPAPSILRRSASSCIWHAATYTLMRVTSRCSSVTKRAVAAVDVAAAAAPVSGFFAPASSFSSRFKPR